MTGQNRFTLSLMELKKPATLTSVSLLVALGVIMGLGTIIPSEFLKIGLNYLITGSIGFLFGPVAGMLGAVAIDLIGFVARPTGTYFFGFTFNALVTGFIYGWVLYRRPVTLWRVALAKGLVSLIVNILLSTLWLSMLYGKAFFVLLPLRAGKNLLALPFEVLLLLAALKAVGMARRYAVRAS